MPEFRFKIVDAEGERRTGSVTAESYQAAKSALIASSTSILELEEVAVEAPSLELDNPGTRLWVALSATASLVLILSLAAALFGGKEEQRRSSKATMETISLTVTGKLASRPNGEVTVHAILPELPLEAHAVLKQGSQSFEIPVEIRSPRRPAQVILELSQEGKRWKADDKLGIGTDASVDFGLVPYSPPDLQPRRYRKPRKAYRAPANPKAELQQQKAERKRERQQRERERVY